MPILTLNGRNVEYELLPGPGAPALVFLHEGLGSVALWQGFPARLCAEVGRAGVVYSRHGYGRSSPLTGRRDVGFMHREAQELPALLTALGIERPVLFGHSDGASIALITAGAGATPLAGVVSLAAHVFVEEVTLKSIRQARESYLETDLRARLSRYHDDPDSAFWGWNDVWLDPAFAAWNIEALLPAIRCPVLAIQGEDDEYGTLEQLARIRAGVPHAQTLLLPRCRHSPHRDRPDEVIAAVRRFVASL